MVFLRISSIFSMETLDKSAFLPLPTRYL